MTVGWEREEGEVSCQPPIEGVCVCVCARDIFTTEVVIAVVKIHGYRPPYCCIVGRVCFAVNMHHGGTCNGLISILVLR